ncbi:MAG: hypothetical protein VBE63_00860 [Lamprobacter sp.]|uniref:hypothetical protein n=1 Tax=Lamprobacter sp. TaxID=3100796 RepID=UPI002B262B42|nr:hypothetical protein [Lamprobacter sp.]MEA3638475.1 hypothetical protein [Lamprobacter sp.]
MVELFASGRIIDLILILVLVEALVFGLAQRLGKQTPNLTDLLPNLAAGFLLLLSLRAALANAHWVLIALPLGLALLAHLLDLAGRWPKRDPKGRMITDEQKQCP